MMNSASNTQRLQRANLPVNDDDSNILNSTGSKALKGILSNDARSKQHSFNSPRSLSKKIQLTNEKIKSSIDSGSVQKGRKLFMLDEAGLAKQSLKYGSSNVAESMAVKKLHSSLAMGPSGEKYRPDTIAKGDSEFANVGRDS